MAQKNSKKEIKWDKLDNTAHIFPVIAGESMRCISYFCYLARGD